MIYVVKVTANQERVVAELAGREALSRRKQNVEEGKEVYSVLYTTGLKGYILVEADGPGTVEDLVREVPKTRGLLLKKKGDIESAGTIPIEELEKTLCPKPQAGNLFAAAAPLQVALGALLARQGTCRVLANCFGHGSEQAAFVLEPA